MNAAGEIAQFDRSLVECDERSIEDLRRAYRLVRECGAGATEGGTERDQALLRAVVQVALQPLTFGDDRFGDAVSRCTQFLFGTMPLGQVTQIAGEHRTARHRDPRDGQLDREHGTIRACR